MSAEMYEILSLFARYFFAGLMVLIVLRAWRITIKDNRRAKLLRNWSPETGCVGQLVIAPGQKNAKLVPIPREGVLGSSSSADMQIAAKGILKQHAHVESREGGLLIRPIGRAQMALGKGQVTGDQLLAQDGDMLTIGPVKALVVLFEPGTKPLDAAPTPDAGTAKGPQPKPGQESAPKPPKSGRARPNPTPPPDSFDFFDEGIEWLNEQKKSKRRS